MLAYTEDMAKKKTKKKQAKQVTGVRTPGALYFLSVLTLIVIAFFNGFISIEYFWAPIALLVLAWAAMYATLRGQSKARVYALIERSLIVTSLALAGVIGLAYVSQMDDYALANLVSTIYLVVVPVMAFVGAAGVLVDVAER